MLWLLGSEIINMQLVRMIEMPDKSLTQIIACPENIISEKITEEKEFDSKALFLKLLMAGILIRLPALLNYVGFNRIFVDEIQLRTVLLDFLSKEEVQSVVSIWQKAKPEDWTHFYMRSFDWAIECDPKLQGRPYRDIDIDKEPLPETEEFNRWQFDNNRNVVVDRTVVTLQDKRDRVEKEIENIMAAEKTTSKDLMNIRRLEKKLKQNDFD
jgi:hypothetical protein